MAQVSKLCIANTRAVFCMPYCQKGSDRGRHAAIVEVKSAARHWAMTVMCVIAIMARHQTATSVVIFADMHRLPVDLRPSSGT